MNGHVLEYEKDESPQKSKTPESCNQQGDYVETTLKTAPITIAHQTGTAFSIISGKKCNRIASRSSQTNKKKFIKDSNIPDTNSFRFN